ncbi:hypothetical protein [Providencia alcalifaciens]|uniref:hypothetical protein n=1 Tax=Providencia alcalifaciens TaxID=126385 RepID=UPI001CC5F976|nr:hypothetical protein [Providencia alcalifaciens]
MGNINKIPTNWRVAKGFVEKVKAIESTPIGLLNHHMNQPKITNPESINTLRNEIKNTLLNNSHENKRIGIAVYGFSTPQLKSCRFIRSTKPEKSITTIANFNQALGLNKEILNYGNASKHYMYQSLHQQLNTFIDVLSEHEPKYEPNFSDSYLNSCLYLWKDYLHKYSYQADIFQYINLKESSIEDKNKLIHRLIIKNTSEKTVPKALYKYIIDHEIFNCTSLSEFKIKMTELNKDNKLRSVEIITGLFELIQNHLFRNTSKIGLDFFRKNAFSILMTWNDEDNNPFLFSDIGQKAFKHGNRRSFNGHDYVEPITFSEIRHLERNKKKFTDKIVRIITDDTQVAFSLGLDSPWGIYDKADFLPKSTPSK